jgi:nucleoside-diphosphate-sugar epimerase
MAEQLILSSNCDQLETVVLRTRLVYGADDTVLLKSIVDGSSHNICNSHSSPPAVNSGAFRWINDGLTMTSMCHVQNVCEGLVCAAERYVICF